MKIAIPVFKSRVSPRFDCTLEVLIITICGADILKQTTHTLNYSSRFSLVQFLEQAQVELLLCGGIRRCDRLALEQRGIEVRAELRGDIQKIINNYLVNLNRL